MNETEALITAEECTLLMVDFQAGLGFGVESAPRQAVLNNAIALARTAVTFSVPVVVRNFRREFLVGAPSSA